MKNCREITRLLSESQERELSLKERTSLKLHLAICSGCRNFSKQMGSLRSITRAYTRGAPERTGDNNKSGK
ncbi:zf-HC2 domain-containing protein [Microbulbifer taiwanensis]|uniref:Zf-HC2 domain-containing protein n=1 Tax=Microbulbifer taiwanensis TaxID=986746 RepID=A0ABW1YSR3_9GAMM|nr:zf-HC2 domain-containing protein [Microbulbifer taiwanensis]